MGDSLDGSSTSNLTYPFVVLAGGQCAAPLAIGPNSAPHDYPAGAPLIEPQLSLYRSETRAPAGRAGGLRSASPPVHGPGLGRCSCPDRTKIRP